MSTLTIDGRDIVIEPVRVRDLPRFLAAIEPVLRELAEGDLTAALMRQADRVIEAAAIGAGVEREWLEAQTPDALIEIATAVLEVNADFFVRIALPRLTAAAERLAAIASGGMSGSPGSPPPASGMTP